MIRTMSEDQRPTRRISSSISEDVRRTVSLWLAWVMWTTTVVLVILRVLEITPTRFTGLSLLTTGVAVAASLSRGRMRLADTIAETFETGLKVATVLQTNVTTAACMIETDLDGEIQTVEHPEVIGWSRDDLIGQNLNILIPDRFLRQHAEGFKRFRETGQTRVAGATLNVPTLDSEGKERGMRLTVARLGDTFLGTLVPVDTPERVAVLRDLT